MQFLANMHLQNKMPAKSKRWKTVHSSIEIWEMICMNDASEGNYIDLADEFENLDIDSD